MQISFMEELSKFRDGQISSRGDADLTYIKKWTRTGRSWVLWYVNVNMSYTYIRYVDWICARTK